MNQVETQQELLELIRANYSPQHIEVNHKTLRYALYARKSTLAEDRQERSIDDQIRDCTERIIKPEGLRVVKVIQEKASAKDPDTRLQFQQLINDIKAGRINGLISWHPDRLARNMKDAGEIIDLLDKMTLKDLRFATSTFENNPTGKMLLGISFVLSKQYSEHLSESVSRGNRRATEDDGEFIGKFKHGYYVDENRHLYPDEKNFLIVKQMFSMRLEGASQKDIRDWLNTTNYQVRKQGKDPRAFTWDKDDVSKVLRDPVYAGILKYGTSVVNLSEKYDFTPIISPKEFIKLNKVDGIQSKKILSAQTALRGSVRANLMRGMVYCGFCNKSLSSSLTSKKRPDGEKVWYYHYKCETESCEFKNKSIKASVVINFAREFFGEYMFVTKDNYKLYVQDAKSDIKFRVQDIDSLIHSLTTRIGKAREDYNSTKELLKQNPELEKHYNLDTLKGVLDDLEVKMSDLVQRKSDTKGSIAPYEKYLELLQSIPVILSEMKDMNAMDAVMRKFFSNFTVKQFGKGKEQRWEIDYKLKEPWQGFLESNNFVFGRGERAQTFDLSVPNRARYQLRHTPMCVRLG